MSVLLRDIIYFKPSDETASGAATPLKWQDFRGAETSFTSSFIRSSRPATDELFQ